MAIALSRLESTTEPTRAIAGIAQALAIDPRRSESLAPLLHELLGIDIAQAPPAARAVLVYLAAQLHDHPGLDCADEACAEAPPLTVSDWLSVDARLLELLNEHCERHGWRPILIDPPLPPRDLRRCLGGITLHEYVGFYRGTDLPAGDTAEFVFDLEREHPTATLPADLAFVAGWLDPETGAAIEASMACRWEVDSGQLFVEVAVPQSCGAVCLRLDVYAADASGIIRRAPVLELACTVFERGAADYGLIHLHLRCTAGVAVSDFLRERYGEHAVAEGYRYGPDGPTSFKSLETFAKKFAGGRFAACHFRRGFFRGEWPTKVFLSIVRDPVDRVLSMYNYCRRHCLEHGPEMVANWRAAGFSFESVRETWERHILFEDDSMCRYLSGRPSFRATLERLRRDQRVIGCFDDRQPLLDWLADLTGADKIELPASEVAPNGGYREALLAREPGLEAFLYDHNREDLALYRHCRAERLVINVSDEVEAGLRRRFRLKPGAR